MPGTAPTLGVSKDEYIYQTYWLPDSIPSVIATFMSTNAGAWKKELVAVRQTVPATSYSSLANSDALDNDILLLGVTYDGTILYKKATGTTTSTGDPKYLYFSGPENGLAQVSGPLFGGIFSPNSKRVLQNGIDFMNPFGGTEKVTPVSLPKNIFGWYLSQD